MSGEEEGKRAAINAEAYQEATRFFFTREKLYVFIVQEYFVNILLPTNDARSSILNLIIVNLF